MKRPTVDPKSYDLAVHFLSDSKHVTGDEWSLAAAIQKAAEDWLEDFQARTVVNTIVCTVCRTTHSPPLCPERK